MDVTVVRSADALDDADVGADTTVVVTSTELLGAEHHRPPARATRPARRLVWSSPGPGTTDAFGLDRPPDRVSRSATRSAADCADPTYAGLSIAVDVALAYPVDDGCFPTERRRPARRAAAGRRAARRRAGAEQRPGAARRQRRRRAAAARPARPAGLVRPGARRPGRPTTGSASRRCCPAGCGPALWLVALAALALLVWRVAPARGRSRSSRCRSSVKAIETTRSRGRLYRKAGDRAHAAERAARRRPGARGRAAAPRRPPRPGRPRAATSPATPAARSPRSTRCSVPRAAPPATDHDLITLADQLAELDREVRRP